MIQKDCRQVVFSVLWDFTRSFPQDWNVPFSCLPPLRELCSYQSGWRPMTCSSLGVFRKFQTKNECLRISFLLIYFMNFRLMYFSQEGLGIIRYFFIFKIFIENLHRSLRFYLATNRTFSGI